MIETDLLSLLKNYPAISDIVGERIYPMYLPQGLRTAAIVYQQIGSPTEYSCDGPELIDYRFQITCWSPTSVVTSRLAAAVKRCFYNAGFANEGILAVRIENMSDVPYTGEVESAVRYGKFVDVVISYRE